MRVQYSTPTMYLDAIKKENLNYPTKEDDFMPYADCIACYWTGFFTSRVALKGIVKNLGRYLQGTRNYLSLLHLNNRTNFTNNQNWP